MGEGGEVKLRTCIYAELMDTDNKVVQARGRVSGKNRMDQGRGEERDICNPFNNKDLIKIRMN